MKKTKRKILYMLAVVVSVIMMTLFYKNHSPLSSDLITPEALAAGENGGFNCVDAPGFCIIDGLPINGVTYKE